MQGRESRDALRHFPDAGLTVMRRGGDYLLVTNGIVGTRGFGNHKHNDLLGFEYHADGDAGHRRSRQLRLHVGSGRAESVSQHPLAQYAVSIDGRGTERASGPSGSSGCSRKRRPSIWPSASTPALPSIEAVIAAIRGCREPVVHERTFTLSNDSDVLTIADVLEGRGHASTALAFSFRAAVERLRSRPSGSDIGTTGAPSCDDGSRRGWPRGTRAGVVLAVLRSARAMRGARPRRSSSRLDGRREYVFRC